MINFRLIRHLWLFLAVAEEQNFGRAAKRLGMSQPPLTEQIKVLEASLRVKLFERTSKGAVLTPAGLAIMPAVRKFAEQLERLELAVHEAVAGQTAVLTIGAINAALVEVLPGLIEQLKMRFPQASVFIREIDSGEAVPSLETGDIDVAFARIEGGYHDPIRSIPLVQDRLAVALSKNHPLANQEAVDLRTLADDVQIMFARGGSPVFFDYIVNCCQQCGFRPKIMHEVRSIGSQISFVSCGQGIALVPYELQRLAPSNVVIRPLMQEFRLVTSALAWNSARHHPLVEALIELVRVHYPVPVESMGG
ncbi:TPA: LysR family transcriptional regulator [Pseudomonas putida]|uniref:LysR family transcriptional regulator n=1 Tax=Pseudomonas putida TaxID=303 RepID=A0AAP9N035_PSEPU|nr:MULTISPECIES: LysR family transcriptional regulator [Pseudomonas]MCS4061398.1 DNA-binding transcriptional LysR family regulator [Pseudomonas putida]MDD1993641.1 LysR family transcriptional regulator [Pseudomonas putida]QJQ10268.1 LysR family transcriptional regulator [Pseudomonas putida]HDS0916453.1 LysR family transcriptional regulator [Pseudomonas putida]HDS0932088.1 LysR family transcriptional regulator [Pseudomonas putida]